MKRAIRVLQQRRPRLGWVLLALAIVAVVVGLWAGYTRDNNWTGFRDYRPAVGEPERGKTLWDWLDLLIVPSVLALGALWVNRNSQRNEQRRADRENEIEREIASDRNQEAALQAYLDRMTDLLLKEDLRTSQPGDEVRTVARTRTLTVLRGLEAERRSAVIWFLIETGLVSVTQSQEWSPEATGEPIVSLEGAQLEETELERATLTRASLWGVKLSKANLANAALQGTNLKEANLERANLMRADLRAANLTGVNLKEANLLLADLRGAELRTAHLERANLAGAYLLEANLRVANLEEADMVGAHLEGADLTGINLRGVTLPDGTTWTPSTDMTRFTNPPSNDGESH